MARVKIDYGIDLGTTNSAIAFMDNGNIKIIKSDKSQKDTTPSCVHFNKKQTVFVGDDAISQYRREMERNLKNAGSGASGSNSFIEFKRTMGTDKLDHCPNMNRTLSPEELSAEVLKKLKSYVRDEDVNAAVITVPAKFQQHQVDATQRATDLSGFGYVELLQEPIAASMAYGIDAKVLNGYWLMFDFGGGTFDAALMKIDEGIMKVVDTEGDNQLGGKNIDYAIVDQILITYLKDRYAVGNILSDDVPKVLLRDALKGFAEEIKIALSSRDSFEIYTDEPIGDDDNGEEMELDLIVSLDDFDKVVKPIFQRAIDITLKLLKNNNLKGSDLETVNLVGGPTFSQTFRNMLKEQITVDIDTSIDPMTAVARGAALFASTKEIPVDLQQRDKTKIQLTLKFPETTVETEEKLGIRIDRNKKTGDVPEKIFTEITRTDKGWSSGKIEVVDDAEIITIQLNTGKSNGFSISLFDKTGTIYPCEPDSFTVIQGLKAANATLPYDLCIDVYNTQIGKQRLIDFSGLKKNQSLPAKGKETLKTQKDIRPGNKQDVLKIPFYNGEKESRAILNNYAGIILITGDDLPEFLPKDSDVEVTLEVDSSRRITANFYFPYIDETVEKHIEQFVQKEFDADEIENEINRAKHTVEMIKNDIPGFEDNKINRLNKDLDDLACLLENGRGDHNTKTQVMENLRELLKEIDRIQDESEWPKVEEELNEALVHITLTNERYGNEKTNQLVAQFEKQTQVVIRGKNIKLAKELTSEIYSLDYTLVKDQAGLWISYVKGYDEEFDMHDWKNRNAARQLINKAKENISTHPSAEVLQRIVRQLFELLPESDKKFSEIIDDEVLKK